MTLKPSSDEGGSKYAVIASNSASVVHGVPAGSPLLRSLSCRLHKSFDASMKWSSCATPAFSTKLRNQARCFLVLAGKSSTTDRPLLSNEKMWEAKAFLIRAEYFTKA